MRTTIAVIIMLIAACTTFMEARTRTTQRTLRNPKAKVEMLPADSADATYNGLDSHAISLRGYSKRASDNKESFFVTNNTHHPISHVTLLMRYSTLSGKMLHERTVTIPVSLNAGESELVAIKSWDVQRLFYYYSGAKPKKSATPFKVAFRLMGYDIPIGKK